MDGLPYKVKHINACTLKLFCQSLFQENNFIHNFANRLANCDNINFIDTSLNNLRAKKIYPHQWKRMLWHESAVFNTESYGCLILFRAEPSRRKDVVWLSGVIPPVGTHYLVTAFILWAWHPEM